MQAALRIFHLFSHALETILRKERSIFVRRKGRVIQRLSAKSADGFAVLRPAGEQQRSARFGVCAEDGEGLPLVVVTKVEEAVPRHHAVDGPSERQCAHVGDDPFAFREVALRKRDPRGRGTAATDLEPRREQIGGHGFARTAPKIENWAARLEQRTETVEPRLFDEYWLAATVAHPFVRAALVEIDDL